jgi:hypothetical protein
VVAIPAASRYIVRIVKNVCRIMRAETQSIVDDIKRSLGLLRRHL